MEKETVTLTIDGKTATVPKGTNVVDAAKSVGIEIPIFCYHEKMVRLGCCRMCLVEVEKMPKLMTACTIDASEGMVVKNDTPKVVKARQGVLEFTLLNHPLDCPVCDKGGECPLQDNTFNYGAGDTRMEFKRFNNVKKKELSPVITLDRERCIACQRCTTFSEVIERDQALVMHNRGFHNDIGTFNDQPYDTRFSGNVIDICPVGALTNSIFRFQARTWDLDNSKTLCAHCACNCNIEFGARENELMRIVSRPNDAVDDGWICDKGRFGYEFVASQNRILEPGIRKDGEMHVASLDEACDETVSKLKSIVQEHGPKSVGFIGSPFASNEELYLYQKLMRMGVGTNNIDYKAYSDTPGLPVAHYDFTDIESSDLIVLIASDPTEELPILDLRLKKAVIRLGRKLIVLNDQKTLMDKYASLSLRYDVGSDEVALGGLAKAVAEGLKQEGAPKVDNLKRASGIKVDEMRDFAGKMISGKKVCVIYNPAALSGNSVAIVKNLLSILDKNPEAECGAIPAAPSTNALGAMDMGILPDFYPGGISLNDDSKIKEIWGESAPTQKGFTSCEMFEKAASGDLKALVVFRSNPLVDFPGGDKIEEALKKVDFVVVHDMLHTETTALAHVVIPSIGPGFDEGTTTNIGGRVQYRRKGLKAESFPDWRILAKLLSGFEIEAKYLDSFTVTAEIAKKVPGSEEIRRGSIQKEGKNRPVQASVNGKTPEVNSTKSSGDGFKLRVAEKLFSKNKILESDSALAHHFSEPKAILNSVDAEKLGIKPGDRVKVSAGDRNISAEATVEDNCNPGAVIVSNAGDEYRVLALVQDHNATVQVSKE